MFWWNTANDLFVSIGNDTGFILDWEFLLQHIFFFLCTIIIILVLGKLEEFTGNWLSYI